MSGQPQSAHGQSSSYDFGDSGTANLATVNALSRQQTILGVTLTVLCFIVCCIRAYVKIFMVRKVKMDDVWIFIAFVLFLGLSVVNLILSFTGAQLARGDYSAITTIMRGATAYNVLYFLCTASCKISIGLFLLGIVQTTDKVRRFIVWSMLAVATSLTFVLIGLSTSCGGSDSVKCNLTDPYMDINIAWSVVNAVCDVTFTLICMQLVIQSQIRLNTKISACCLLAISSVGSVASILRVVTLIRSGWAGLSNGRVLLIRWSTLEAGTCILAACLATLKPLYHKLLVRFGVIPSVADGSTMRTATAQHIYTSQKVSQTAKESTTLDPEKGVLQQRIVTVEVSGGRQF